MYRKKILILKNDRIGDLFSSLETLNKLLIKHKNDEKIFYFSKNNEKFSFLFPNIKKKIVSINLNIIEKIRIFFYIILNKVESIYILKPKNYYFLLAFVFRNIKFYGLTIKNLNGSRPNDFLKKYLYKYVTIDRSILYKRKSTYEIQKELFSEIEDNENLIIDKYLINHKFKFPKKYLFFHYKHNLFKNLLKWELSKSIRIIDFLSKKSDNLLFSSEINNEEINNIFMKYFNTYDFSNNKVIRINNKNIYFLKNIEGADLFDVIKNANIIVAPEGMVTHISYFLKKDIIALLHFELKNKQDFINQLISCKEWFPPKKFKYIALSKDIEKSMRKLNSRIK